MPIPNCPHLAQGDVDRVNSELGDVHKYIPSATEAALSKLAANFQFIPIFFSQMQPSFRQPPISPILYTEVERGGEQGCFARDELGRQETTENIKSWSPQQASARGAGNLVLNAWAHTIPKWSEEESSKLHTVWTCAACMPQMGWKKKLVAGGLDEQNRFAPP